MNTEQYLLYLLKTFISQEEEVLPPPAGVSLKELYESGQKHNVAAMLYGVLRQAGLENEALSEFRGGHGGGGVLEYRDGQHGF